MVLAGTPTRAPRRTQAERTATTRTALLDATLACLTELGYARTTTTAVVARAGVSLGALVHHFPAKSDLLTAAVGHLLARRLQEFRAQAAALPPGQDRVEAVIDLLWAAVSGPTFTAWVELWVGARTDAELAPAVLAMNEAFRTQSSAAFAELFPAADYPGPVFLEQGLAFALSVVEGAALRGLHGQPDDGAVALLKAVAGRLVQRTDA